MKFREATGVRRNVLACGTCKGGDGGARHGFTLVEMLVVITIIGLIMALVGPRVLNYLGESKAKAAKIQIESFSSALDLYYLDPGRYPSTARKAWPRWCTARRGTPGWNGPYLRGGVVPSDPWGTRLYLPFARRTRRLTKSSRSAPTVRRAAVERRPTSRQRRQR